MTMALGILGVFSLSFAAGGPAPASQEIADAAIQEAFSVSRWTVQSIDLPAEVEGAIDVAVVLDGQRYVLSLFPHSLRAAHFQLLVEEEPGVLVEYEPPPPTTYRGTVEGQPVSEVAASIHNGQLTAAIHLDDHGPWWFVQPISDEFDTAPPTAHLVYSKADLIAHEDWTCGVDELLHDLGGDIQDMRDPQGGPGASARSKEADIAYDTDYEFYQKNGYSVPNTIADIERITNSMEVIYLRDVEVCYNISKIIVRSNSNDPYTQFEPVALLNQFRNHWNSQQGGVLRDTAHLMAGRSPWQSVIGIAYLSVVCNRSSAYAISWSKYTSNHAYRTGLTAHEVGHNFSATHCNSRPNCRIMCSGLGGCTRIVTSFGPDAIRQISSFARSRTCMTYCGPTVSCDDIKKLNAKCKKNGVVKGKIKLRSGGFDGNILKVTVDGNEEKAEVKGKKAKFSSFFYDPGKYKAVLIDPPNCNISKKVRCP